MLFAYSILVLILFWDEGEKLQGRARLLSSEYYGIHGMILDKVIVQMKKFYYLIRLGVLFFLFTSSVSLYIVQ